MADKILYDENDNPIVPKKSLYDWEDRPIKVAEWAAPFTQPTPTFSPGISGVAGPNPLGLASKFGGKLESALTVGGGLLPPPAGYIAPAVGSVVGQAISSGLKGQPVDPRDIAANALVGIAIDKTLGKFVQKPIANLLGRFGTGQSVGPKSALYNTFFRNKRTQEELDALDYYRKELQPTVGQVTGNPAAKFMETGFGGETVEQYKAQQPALIRKVLETLRQQVTKSPGGEPLPTEVYGSRVLKSMRQNRTDMKTAESQAHKFVEAIADQNTVPVRVPDPEAPPIFGPNGRPLPGYRVENITPVDLSNSVALANARKKDLKGLFSDSALDSMPAFLRARYSKAKQAINDILTEVDLVNPVTNDPAVAFVRDYKTAARAKKDIGRIIFGKADIDFTPEDVILMDIYKALDKDIQASMGAWKNGGDARLALQQANKLTQERAATFNQRVRSIMGTRTKPGDESSVFSKAFTNKETARELIAATEPSERINHTAAYFDHVIKKSTDYGAGTFDPTRVIGEMINPDSVASEYLSAPYRAKIVRLMTALRPMAEKDPTSGQVALRIREAGLGLSLASGLWTKAAQGTTTSGVKTALMGAVAVLGGNSLARGLADEKNVDLAIRLAKARKNTPEAIALSKKLFLAMKGAEIMVEIPGENQPFRFRARINEQGKVEPIKADE